MNVSDLELFVRVADCGSFSEAARQLNISSAVASAGIKRLEKELGITLLIRSTRQLCLSTAGKQYLRYCRRAITELNEGLKSILCESHLISGQLRLAIPSDFGRNHLLTLMDLFIKEHPLLSLTIKVSDQISDFYSDNIDVAIRYGELEDSNLVAFNLLETQRVVCASPNYIKQFGQPKHPDDLKHHNCLLFKLGENIFNSWVFTKDNKNICIRVNGDRIANDADIVRRWAMAGKGIAFKSRLDVNKEITNGSLIPLLTDYTAPPLNLWLICPTRNLLTPAIMALKDYLQFRLLKQIK